MDKGQFTVGSGSSRVTLNSLQLKRIQDLESYFSNQKIDAGKTPFISLKELAHHLFERAPVHFLAAANTETLADITEECMRLCAKFLSTKDTHLIVSGEKNDSSYIAIVLGDRPFTINTVVSHIRESGSDIQALLHPLIPLKTGKRLSVLYIQFDTLLKDKLEVLKDRITRVISDLVIATDDFPPILNHLETSARLLKDHSSGRNLSEAERTEIAEFLRWLADGGFVFIGLAEWGVEHEYENDTPLCYLSDEPQTKLGIFRSTNHWHKDLYQNCQENALNAIQNNHWISVYKSHLRSMLHRREQLTHIVVPRFSSDDQLIGVTSLLGLFTSKTLAQEANTIPIIRNKLRKVLAVEEAIPNTHSYKNILNIFDSMPKSLLLRTTVDELLEHVHLITNIQRETESMAYVRNDATEKAVNVTVAVPVKRFNEFIQEKIQTHVEQTFGAVPGSGDIHVTLQIKPFALLFYHVPLPSSSFKPVNISNLETELIELTRTWSDNLRNKLLEKYGSTDGENLRVKYRNAFSEEYQASYNVDDALDDIENTELLDEDNPVKIDITDYQDHSQNNFNLTLYSWKKEFSISHALPIFEFAGLHIVREHASQINLGNKNYIYMHRFIATTSDDSVINISSIRQNLCAGLEKILLGEAENDYLNSLLISANLDIKAISVLRLYCAYLWQISSFASKGSIRKTLADIPAAANLLWNMFEVKFNPYLETPIEQRQKKLQVLMRHFKLTLRDVPDINQDRILRVLGNILEATVRTNFYTDCSATAIKISSANVEIMKPPVPYFEIFVRSAQTEGIHIRFGRIARGGIRWSDRRDDFRNEILGLAKTQKIKNALIVPTGSKGGFIVREPSDDQEQLRAQVHSCYQDYIRALLSVTDNRVLGESRSPKNVICYDNEDPYLVVAADKGTATFSDTANKIATEEYHFWLGDAFASGGSNGYDHKLYGITARGAWESVKRHFNDIGLDYESTPFTTVGIGDMSGDVFGNGLILSDNFKLIAAFNHKEIFIDPDPDPKTSYQERKRLFSLARSNWSDYKKELISQGGAVYGRFDKEIELSPQAREALSIPADVPSLLNGEQLISHILKAQCDLLWNGGIGTYVKSSSETHAEVNDGQNDSVRIDSDELRCKVVGEGGNLGFTQKARITFQVNGGLINTDAVDNSGGVDLSDHEVNFKILFSSLLEKGKISLEDRNIQLKKVANAACDDVLHNNAQQALLLTNGSTRSKLRLDYFKSLMRELSHLGYLNRRLESLPDDELLDQLKTQNKGLTRPELSIVFSAVKMWLKDSILSSKLPEDPMLQKFLLHYFPEEIRNQWAAEIEQHPLGKEIIATRVTNELVDIMGATFIHRTVNNYSIPLIDTIKFYLAASEIVGNKSIRSQLDKFDNCNQNDLFLEGC
ncbi:MAG: NAD-glutamate dehydrogenase, partial [Deltaproteobacteria bacterium]|nr:NAD-glutamate dehydrogenase [Deltaproteobacteria bacterium]